jgi:Family of unknown function (DUF6152)
MQMRRRKILRSSNRDQEIIDMRYTLLAGFSGLGVLAATAPALAHHPFFAEFDAQAPLTLSGIVTKMNWGNPHVYVRVDAKDPSGQTRNWTLELASPAMLARKGWTKDSLKIGEVITIKGYRAKSEPFTAAARMIEMPDRKQMSAAEDDDGGPK